MQELKMQNGLLLQLVTGLQRQINSKNRQNQILFQQYEQLAQDNTRLQQQIDQLKLHQNQYKRHSPSTPHPEVIHPRISPFDVELSDLKNKCVEYQTVINELKAQLEQKGGKIVFLENEVENAKLSTEQRAQMDMLRQQLKERNEILQLKQKSLTELTEYMNEQAEKIGDLTKSSILTIQNYETKLAQKDLLYQQTNKQLSQFKEKLNQPKQEAAQNEKIKQLQTIIASKQQSLNELSQFLQSQSQKIGQLQQQLLASDAQPLQKQIENLQQIIASKQQSTTQLSDFLNTLSAKNQQVQEQLEQKQKQLDHKIQYYEELINVPKDKDESKAKQAQIAQLNEVLSLKESEISDLRVQLDQKVLKLTMMQNISQQNQVEFPQDNQQPKEQVQQVESPKEQIDQLKAVIEQKDQSLRDFTEFISQQTQRIAELEKQYDNIQAQFQTKNNEKILELSSIIQSKEQSISELSAYLTQAYQKATNLQADLAANKLNLLQLQQQLSTKKVQNGIVKEEKFVQPENIQDQNELEQLKTSLSQKELECGLLKQQIIAKEKSIEQINKERANKVSELHEQIRELQSIMANKCQTIAQLSQYMNQQAQQLEELRQKVSQSAEKQNLSQNVQESQYNAVQRQQELNKMKQSLQQYNEKIVIIQQQAQASQEYLRKQIEDKEASLIEITLLHKQLSLQINTLREERVAYAQTIQRQNQEINHLTQKIESSNKEVQGIQAEAEQTSPTISNQITTLKQLINDLQATIQSKEQTFFELSEYMNEQSLRIQQLQQKLKTFQERGGEEGKVKQLQQILKSKEQSLTQLTQYLEQTISKNMQLQQLLQDEAKNNQKQPQINQQQKQSMQDQLENNQVQSTEIIKAKLQALVSEIQSKQQQLANIEIKIEDQILHLSTIKQQIEQSSNTAQDLIVKIEGLKQQHQFICKTEHLLKQQYHQELASIKAEVEGYMNQQIELKQQELVEQQQQSRPQQQKQLIATLQAKIKQYEEYLNDREEQMEGMMSVMESLQTEIQNKNQIIERLQSNNIEEQPLESNANEKLIKSLHDEILGLRYTLNALHNQPNEQPQQEQLQQAYYKVQLQQQMLDASANIEKALQKQLEEMNESHNIEHNNEQLTIQQMIDRLDVTVKQQKMQSTIKLIYLLKSAYSQELAQNQQIKQTLNNLLQLNNKLVEQLERLKTEVKQYQQKNLKFEELSWQIKQMESKHQQEIQQLTSSILALKEESPIMSKNQAEHQIAVSRLQDQIILLRQENRQKQVQLQQLRTNSNHHFVKELNNLLDSCTVNKQVEDIKEIEEELQKVRHQRDQLHSRCKQYEAKVDNLQKECLQLTLALQNVYKYLQNNSQKKESINNSHQQDSMHQIQHMENKLLKELQSPIKASYHKKSSIIQQGTYSAEKLKHQNQELLNLISDKNMAINELEQTLLTLEKGYNNQIMSLRKNIAQLNNESIALRKCLYQANPNGIDIGDLIKDTFSLTDKDTQFYKPDFPLYTQNLFYAQPVAHNNNSYYSQVNRVKSNPRSQYQRYFPVGQMNMGEKFMGRKCRQASPFGAYYRDQSRVANSAWEINEMQRY